MRRRTPGIGFIADAPWPRRPDSQVWRVHLGTHSVYVKVSRSPFHYHREVYAYRVAAAALAVGMAPRLLDSDPRLGVIMTSALPGTRALGLQRRTAQERMAHVLAARLLRRWHSMVIPGDSARTHAIRGVGEKVAAAAKHVQRAADLLSAQQRRGIRFAGRELRLLAPRLPLGFRHGDFQPGNWQWHGVRPALGIFDFENSGIGIAVEDFVSLAADTWPSNADLRSACLQGYGRDFTAEEVRALHAYSVLAALDDLQRAHRSDDENERTRARENLARVIPQLH